MYTLWTVLGIKRQKVFIFTALD